MNRRGAVIFVVLIAVVAMAAGLSALLSGVRGQSNAVRSIVTRHESRLAARSAAYAIAAELHRSREEAHLGQIPELPDNEDVLRYEDKQSWQWTIVSADGHSVEPFAARLDLNHAEDAVLEAFFQSNEIDSEHALSHRPIRSLGMARHAIAEAPENPVDQLVTISSLDPQLRSGAGGQSGFVGTPRMGVGAGGEPSSSLSPEGVALYESISSGDWQPAGLGEILTQLPLRSIPEEEWDILLDSFDMNDGRPSYGLVDLSHASANVLSALPGIDEEVAESLVDHRESLSDDDLSGLSWPVREGLMEIDDYTKAINFLTSRSLQYGVRFAVERDEEISESDQLTSDDLFEDITAAQYEMVVDLSGEQPRIGYLRDVTNLKWEVKQPTTTEIPDPAAVFGDDAVELDLPADEMPESEGNDDSTSGSTTGWSRYGTGGLPE